VRAESSLRRRAVREGFEDVLEQNGAFPLVDLRREGVGQALVEYRRDGLTHLGPRLHFRAPVHILGERRPNTYSHVLPELQREAAERMNAVLKR
jgi:hypothetical protein